LPQLGIEPGPLPSIVVTKPTHYLSAIHPVEGSVQLYYLSQTVNENWHFFDFAASKTHI
jgi:hypothetical protein